MIYLDNAATGGFKPESVLRAVAREMTAPANAGRSGHRLSVSALERVYEARKALAEFFHAPMPERVIFTKNCTEALNVAIFGLVREGDHVITSSLEHNSVLRPLFHLKKTKGITLTVVEPDASGEITAESVKSAMTDKTRLVALASHSNTLGSGARLFEIGNALKNSDALFLVDAAQGGGHTEISQSWGIDCLCIAGHKGMLAPQGSGALLLSERADPDPLMFGGTGTQSLDTDQPVELPERYESGTLNMCAVSGMYEAVKHLGDRFYEYSFRLCGLFSKLWQGMKGIKGVRVVSPFNSVGICSFISEDTDSEVFSGILSSEYEIAVRSGYMCAPLARGIRGMSGGGGLIRASLSPFNTEREVDALLFATEKICRSRSASRRAE